MALEIKSVNNRFLQLDLHLPYGHGWLDAPLRTIFSEHVFRGKVFVHLDLVDYAPTQNVVINRSLLTQLFDLQGNLETELKRSVPATLDGLLALPGVMKCEMTEADQQAVLDRVRPVAEKAIQMFVEFRRREGEKMAIDMRERHQRLCGYVAAIEERIPLFREKFQERFSARMTELAQKADLDQTRLSTEIALWTDRSDVSEELTRLKAHLEELGKMLQSTGPIGRKLDFLLQELNREANTINNKIGDLAVIQHSLDVKCELEKIREQVQNIE